MDSVCCRGKLCFVAKGGLRLVLRSRTEIEAALRECHDDPGTTMAKDVIYWVS